MALRNVAFWIAATSVCLQVSFAADSTAQTENPNIDFEAFVKLAKQLEPIRAKRRVPLKQFLALAKERDTIVLDSRSKWAFEAVHIDGAVHLNFSDFSDKKLAEVIPSKKTTILIYCNNFAVRAPAKTDVLDPNSGIRKVSGELENDRIIAGTTLKHPTLALNVPTFINLWGYGYENVYELADVVPFDEPSLPLSGSAVKRQAECLD